MLSRLKTIYFTVHGRKACFLPSDLVWGAEECVQGNPPYFVTQRENNVLYINPKVFLKTQICLSTEMKNFSSIFLIVRYNET